MAFTAQDVKNLREQTGCGMMDCKKALTESGGDFDKAVEYLREKGLAAAQKKAGRIAAEGMVYATVCGKVGVVVEVNAETDFVAKNDMFQAFVKDVANVVAEQNPADVEALLACKMGEDTVEAALKEKILVIGENIKIRRFERYEGVCAAYIHAGGTHAVLVGFDTSDEIAAKPEFETYGKDIAMQIAAANPGYLCEADVPAEVIEKEKEILLVQIANDPKNANKPDAIKEKMVLGRIGKFYKENCLVDQEFVKDAYIHAGGTHAVLVGFDTSDEIAAKPEFETYGKDIAMQIAAANPGYLCEADVPAEVIEKEKEILLVQIANDPKNANKPDAIKEKMVLGRIGKFYKENCLVDQEFVKDNDLTVAKYTDKVAKELGGEIKITKFARYEKGEGLEKKSDDFAAEVASMMK